MTETFAVFLFLGAPAVLLLGVRHLSLARLLGPIVLSYAAGLLLGVSDLLHGVAEPLRAGIIEASLGLALPLLLFSVDIRAWRHVAGRAMLSMGLAVIAVVFVATLLFHGFAARGVEAPEQLSGMAVGMYTGGIANMGAIKLALAIPDARYLLFATVDTFVGALYLLLVLTLGRRLFGLFLAPFPPGYRGEDIAYEDVESFGELLRASALPGIVIALVAAGLCVGAAVLLAPFVQFAAPEIVVIVLLTSFGLLASLIPQIRDNQAASKLGMYLIYVFSFGVAASLDLGALATMDATILIFVAVATFASLLLHALLCRVFRVDVDTFLITSVAALMSPAFVPMVVRSLRNPGILMSGMTTGILGFAIGNYLGISVALLLAPGEN